MAESLQQADGRSTRTKLIKANFFNSIVYYGKCSVDDGQREFSRLENVTEIGLFRVHIDLGAGVKISVWRSLWNYLSPVCAVRVSRFVSQTTVSDHCFSVRIRPHGPNGRAADPEVDQIILNPQNQNKNTVL